ncbi:SAM-dependent methyltransferase [Streptomyces sp. NBC_01092]|uniref:SAM-dependent methyltransferase n=1 Tax=Streptomyces sp. NBC_01092 TaxID=2903748 RepID=UPI00386EE07D|nr:methyltransferase domain-containing protein [Streptomyces sp. NBC_01092]
MSRFDIASRLLEDEAAPSGWCNLGDWSTASTFAEACRALAIRVGEAAGMRAGGSVLDLGFGGGASLALWADKFDVARVDGVELRTDQVCSAGRSIAANLHTGDVFTVLSSLEESYDSVVSVDAAYHFGSLSQLLSRVAPRLVPSGRIALTTLAWPAVDSRSSRWLWRRGLALAAIPEAAVVRLDQLFTVADSAGLCDCRVKILDEPVMVGFSEFIRRRPMPVDADGRKAPGWRKISATARLCGSATKTRQLHYVLLSAEKKP